MALTAKQALFCEEYIANGYNGTRAYLSAFGDVEYKTAKCNASKLLKRDDIRGNIRELQKERFEALNLSAERIACELADLAFSEFDDNNTATSKLKALDLLQKQMGLQNQKMEISGEQKIVISIGEDEE